MSTLSKDFSAPDHSSPEWGSFVNNLQYGEGWQQFVFSLFRKGELIEGYPSADGLWRVARYILKAPLSYTSTVVKAPSHDDGGATVVVQLTYAGNIYSGAADVNPANTKEPFNRHPSATAETKALGRAIKKLLCLSIHTYEEMLDEGGFERINDVQIKSIKNMCERLNVDYEKYLAARIGLTPDNFEKEFNGVSNEQGKEMLEELNGFQGKKGSVPEEFALK